MTDPRQILAEIQERADAATPGTWQRRTAPLPGESKAEWLAGTCHGDEPLQVLISQSDDPRYTYLVPALTGDGPTSVANAEFIASARADVPRLVAALTAVLDAEDTGAWRTGGQGDIRPWDREAWLKGYVFAREEALKAITDALGVSDA